MRQYDFNTKRIGNMVEEYYIDSYGNAELIIKYKLLADGQWRDDVEYMDTIDKATRKRFRKSSFFCRR